MKHFSYKPSDAREEFFACFGYNMKELAVFLAPFLNKYRSFVYIVDKNLSKKYLEKVIAITKIKIDNNIVFVDPSAKTINKVIPLWNFMVMYVPDAAIVVGGGTIGDISGFACGTYQRGIPRIYFPTTVLSMVDASIGGKSGIDHVRVKNSIGVIHYPNVVVSYTPFLESLHEDEYCSGFAEIIKAAVIYDEKFFEQLESFSQSLSKHKHANQKMVEIFHKSSLIKAKICEEPNNKKIILLFGHAVGHAYEKLTQGHKRHGDCVAIGMCIEGALSVLLGLWNKQQWLRLEKILINFNLPTAFPSDINLAQLLAKMLRYKKLVDKENYLFSLPDKVGHINNLETSCLTPIKKTEMKGFLMKTLTWIEKNSYVQR